MRKMMEKMEEKVPKTSMTDGINPQRSHKKRAGLAMLLVLMLTFGLAGCGSTSANMADQAAPAATADGGSYDVKEDTTVEDAATEESGMTSENDPGTSEAPQTDEKIIYTYNYSVETKQFDTFMDTVQKRISEYGGYLESSETNGNTNLNMTRYTNMVIRIPADKMDQFLAMVKENSNVTYAGCSTENVTLSYVDLQSHIKALKVEQETLMGLLERATKLSDVLKLQEQLTDVRYQLESYESQLRVYDNRIDYATLYLDINEVERETNVADKLSYGEEIRQGLSDTFYALGQGFRGFSIWFIVNLPVILLLAVIVLVVVVIIRKVIRRQGREKRKKWEVKQPQKEPEKELEKEQEKQPEDSGVKR